jgi:hypothetical protein
MIRPHTDSAAGRQPLPQRKQLAIANRARLCFRDTARRAGATAAWKASEASLPLLCFPVLYNTIHVLCKNNEPALAAVRLRVRSQHPNERQVEATSLFFSTRVHMACTVLYVHCKCEKPRTRPSAHSTSNFHGEKRRKGGGRRSRKKHTTRSASDGLSCEPTLDGTRRSPLIIGCHRQRNV